jgi:uncharacterized C2H2 Zn-finger protein
MQVHRPRTFDCPFCGEERFQSSANAVQHVESGYCTECRGRGNARKELYKLACSNNQLCRYITDCNDGDGDVVPDLPYTCPDCDQYFRHESQLLQHLDHKHDEDPLN